MILVTGATGFIGRALVRHFSEAGQEVRVLLRPSASSPRLPKGVPVEVAVASLNDARGVRAALRGVRQAVHLASAAGYGRRGDLQATDVEGTRILADAAKDAGLERLLFLSHVGANRASAFPVHKAKGIAEEAIRKSGTPYTIVRSTVVFGAEDRFTNELTAALRAFPLFFPLPGGGLTLLQPLWVEDLVTALLWALQDPEMLNKTHEIGGGEYFTFRQIIETLMSVAHATRTLFPLSLPITHALFNALDPLFPRAYISSFWLDYISANRTCPVDNLTRTFGLMPARFSYQLNYLARKPLWQRLQESLRLR